ncbi:MAG: hypothetical protein JWO31_883 [Phycisphaerales bacterium]|nr:hypothetical protein [Phycisphaerales bacterium]
MRAPHVDDYVRLTQAVPELNLDPGEVGVVRSTWFEPTTAYDVEFGRPGSDQRTRTLLRPEQVELQNDAASN